MIDNESKESIMTNDDLKQATEYHRGYVDGRASRDASDWSLAMQRDEVVRRLQNTHIGLGGDSFSDLSAIAACVISPSFGWTAGACEMLRCELIRLLGGESYAPTGTVEDVLNEYGDEFLRRYLASGERHTELALEYARKLRMADGDAE